MGWFGINWKLNREAFEKSMTKASYLQEKNQANKEDNESSFSGKYEHKQNEKKPIMKEAESINQQSMLTTNFFDEFVNSYQFQRNPKNNLYEEFESLTKFMKWDDQNDSSKTLLDHYASIFLNSLKIVKCKDIVGKKFEFNQKPELEEPFEDNKDNFIERDVVSNQEIILSHAKENEIFLKNTVCDKIEENEILEKKIQSNPILEVPKNEKEQPPISVFKYYCIPNRN